MKTKQLMTAPWMPVFDEQPKTLTQEQVDKILSDEREKFNGVKKKYDDELQALKARTELTDQERKELDERIARLQSEHTTKAEQLQAELSTTRKQSEAQIKKIEAERMRYQSLFAQKMISSEITQAASIHKAVNPGQIMALIGPMTELVEELDEEGKPNGNFVPQVKYPTTDKDGKKIVLTLPVDSAVKRMREDEIHANLFQYEGNGGSGSRNTGGTKVNMAELLRDPVKYRKAREEGLID